MQHCGGPGGDRVGGLPGLAVAHAGAAETVGDANLNEVHTGSAHGVVVKIALAARDDDLVLHPRRIGQPIHLAGVEPGDASGSTEHEPGSGARCDQSGLGTSRLRDDAARRRLEFRDVDAMTRRLDHRLCDRRRHDAAAQTGRRPLAVDDGAHAEALIDVRHGAMVAAFRHAGEMNVSGPGRQIIRQFTCGTLPPRSSFFALLEQSPLSGGKSSGPGNSALERPEIQ